MRRLSVLCFIICASAGFINESHAQGDEVENVKATIKMLFDGMRASDSSMVADAFSEDAVMKTVAKNQQGETVIRTGDLARFKQAVGSPKEKVWDERIQSYNVSIDGDLASVWTPYQFWVGDEFSHCGVNSFQLARLNGQWEIIFIIDTRRSEGCLDN